MRRSSAFILLTLGVFCCVLPAAAQKKASVQNSAAPKKKDAGKRNESDATPKKKNDAKSSRAKSANRVSLTPGREAAAMTFARLHHPELAKLVTKLKKRKVRQYDQAVRQLFQTSERLARTRERTPDRYELSLEAWKLDSRIRLMAARMTMNSDSQLEEDLKELLRAKASVRLRRLTKERERLAERLQRVDALIERIDSDPDASTKKELQRIKRSFLAKGSRNKKPSARPVVAPNPRRVKSVPEKKSKKPL
ncbi:MAG: hypothetical protein HON53_13305 [Planctomycetaceae bacterium]|jgi:hypothetical protein|nr:hypothetical protein [Planctomycetaceae bacterium]MBT6155413.1 hypothetical protein [Planctomycetaceae bacterium]MBT6487593.1 hypothetical protein [Planctomycetaceae bacterium]MBT6493405.1 hypothetical protein [Planctomycetaceae bacterium]